LFASFTATTTESDFSGSCIIGYGTKGNANQQSTRRAQDRESVSQALERVRLAARRGKKEKFTSLLHHVDHEMLRTSFYALKRDAAPGVDGTTW
jgi:hypothetical protein